MPGTLQPLDNKFSIVDELGRPTEYFTRWAQQKQIDIGDSITLAQAQQAIDDWAAARQIIAGRALDGGGFLSSDVTIDHAESLVVPGTYGDATHVPRFVVDQEGHIQGVVLVAISGGGGLTVFSAQNNVSGSTGLTPTNQTAVISVNIPASAVAQTFMVNGNITWRTGVHGMRGGVLLDATQVWPNVISANQGVDTIMTGDGLDHLQYAGILVTVPGDGAAHTISLSWESQTATSALTIENRQITAIKIA